MTRTAQTPQRARPTGSPRGARSAPAGRRTPTSAAAGGVLVLDAGGQIAAADDGAAAIVGRPASSLQGCSIWDLVKLNRSGGTRGVLRRRPDLKSLVGGSVDVETREPKASSRAELTVTALEGSSPWPYAAYVRAVKPKRTRPGQSLAAAVGALGGFVLAVTDANGVVTHTDGLDADDPELASALRTALRGTATTLRIDRGELTFEVTAGPIRNEDGRVIGATAVGADATALRAAERRLSERDGTDEVTGLPKRTELEPVLDAILADARQDAAVAVLCVGLDDLRLVNAALGVRAGDALMRDAAERLRALCDDAPMARLASDQFAIVLRHLSGNGERNARTAASELLDRFARRVTVAGIELHSSAGIGIAVAPRDGTTAGDLLGASEAALREAKDAGPGQVATVRADRVTLLDDIRLTTRLRDAAERGEFHLQYQPIFWLAHPAPYGVEALLRWNDPERGVIPPDRFIPIAERTGLIGTLGRWVFGELCRQARVWETAGVFPQMHWNVSVLELVQPDFADGLIETIAENGIAPKRFTLEITESTAVLERDRTVPVLQRLEREGLRIAIDDFGAGHSSLSRLKDIPAHVLKIDRALVSGLPASGEADAIVSAALSLAKSLGMQAVAEGIETEPQRAYLAQRGCPLGQGYRLGRPRTA